MPVGLDVEVLVMGFVCKTKWEKAWLVASVTAFVLHRLLEVEPHSGAMWLVEALMVALSFPFGPIAMLFILMGVEGASGYADLSWLLDWSTLLFVGYIQWFWVLPEIRRNSQLTTLNLAQPVEMVSALPSNNSATLAITLPATVPPFVFNSATFLPPLTEFDEAGLTALDRVLQQAQMTSSPLAPEEAPPLLSHVESIFTPAV